MSVSFPAAPIDYVADWPARLRGRLYEQFKGEPTWEAWCVLIGRQAQDLEDAIQSLLTIPSIDDSRGVQLDMIGRLIGQPRNGFGDVAYRLLLRARIAANNSSGAPEDIYRVMVALMGPGFAMKITRSPVKSFLLQILTPIASAVAAAAGQLLGDAKAATDQAVMEWQEFTDDQMFVFAQGSQLLQFVSVGQQSLPLVDTSMLTTPTGLLRIDQGQPGEEVVVYQASGPTGVGVLLGLTASHATGARVEMASGPTGLGWARGGQLSAASATGATSLPMFGTTGMTGPTGLLLIDAGEPAEEIAAYVVTDGTHVKVSILTKAHPTGCTAAVLGFGGGLGGAMSPTGKSAG